MTVSPLARAPLTAALAAGLASASLAHAAGFAIVEQSAAGLGNAYAGAAAVAEDASTIAFNPAGLAHVESRQLVLAGHVISPSTRLKTGAAVTFPSTATTIGGGLGGDAGTTPFVPNLYGAFPLGDGVVAGFGIYAPFGLATKYDRGWAGRYHAVESDLKTVSIVPTVAVRASERLALGVGLNVQYAKAKLTNAMDYSAICLGIASNPAKSALTGITLAQCAGAGLTTPGNTAVEGMADVTGDSWSFGVNLGLTYRFGDGSRLGLVYRSSVSHRLEGDADFSNQPSLFTSTPTGRSLFVDTKASAPLELPDSVSLSLAVPRGAWTFLADATWTNWSRFDQLVISYDRGDQGATVTNENWEDSWRFSLGASYRYGDRWTLRMGVAYDQTPIPDAEHRTPRIPGNDRRWVAVGASYRARDGMRLDFGYAHLFVSDTPIRNTSTQGHLLTGTYESDVDIVSAQLVWEMG